MASEWRRQSGPLRVTDRTRMFLRRMMQAFDESTLSNPGETTARIAELIQRGRDAGDLGNALDEVMGTDEPMQRLTAAQFTLVVRFHCATMIGSASFKTAERIILDGLEATDPDTVTYACAGLTTEVAVTATLTAKLRELIESRSKRIAVWAAAALAAQSNLRSKADVMAVLRQGLFEDDVIGKIVSAVALMRLGLSVPGVRQAVESQFKTLPQGGRVRVLIAMTHAEVGLREQISFCTEVLADSAEDPTVRMWAAHALGNIVGGPASTPKHRTRAAEQMMVCANALDCPWEVLSGVANGLKSLGSPEHIFAAAVSRLGHPNLSMRATAARVLGELESGAAAAVPQLAERLRVETDVEVLRFAGGALGRIRPVAIPLLLNLLTDGNVLQMEVAARAISMTGEEGIRTLGELIPTIDNDRVQLMVATILFSLGANASPAVAGLAHLLDSAEDAEAAMFVSITLFHAGRATTPVLDALVRRVADFDADNDPAAKWCQMTLSRHRADALPLLKHEVSAAAGRRRERLYRMIEEFSPGLDLKIAYLDRLKEPTIRNFVSIGLLLEKSPQRTIEDLIDALDKGHVPLLSKTNRARPRWTRKAIERTLSDIEKEKGKRKTVTRGSGTKEVRLAALGDLVLEDAKQYLATLDARRHLIS